MNRKIKTTISVLLSMIFVFALFVPAFAADLPKGAVLVTDSTVINADEVKIIAYRGLSACAPENTIPAFRLAGRSGCDACEIDVQPTVDGVWYCFADITLDSKTSASGILTHYTSSELASVIITKGNNLEEYPQEKIPTVTEAINICKLYNMDPYLVIKSGSVNEVKSLLSTLKTLGVLSSTTIISNISTILAAVKEAGGKTAYSALSINSSAFSTCRTNNYNGIYASSSAISNDVSIMKSAVANDYEILCYGINDLKTAEKFYNNTVKTFMSTSLVKHTPSAEKVTDSLLTTFTDVFKKIADFFVKLVRKIIVLLADHVEITWPESIKPAA